MRNLNLFNAFRVDTRTLYGWSGNETCGAFVVPSPIDKANMAIIASCDSGWEHVSVSRANRCPNWPEMEYVKRMFFKDDECVMQLHVPAGDHLNHHRYCLHMWRPLESEIPRPPGWMVAPEKPAEIKNAG